MPRLLLVLFALLLLSPAAASAADPPPGSVYEEDYIDPRDGSEQRLHVDVLKPAGLAPGEKSPVILTVSPYTNHAAQTGIDYDPTAEGPSPRFFDFLEAAKVFTRDVKYTYVMVDLRGFGGSTGCNDWGGPGEQADVKAAVEWAASQPWSTGKVGMYGKSYDAWTGLMGIAQQPAGLAGVVAQEPVVDGYRYLYMNRVRFTNSVATPTLFSAIDATPGSANDSASYNFNGLQKDPTCYPLNVADQQEDDPESAFWMPRDLLPATKGKRTPLFLTQGYLERNTKPDGVFELYNGLAGPKRAWFGQFDHVRGNDRDGDGRFAMGRPGFIEETMRFFDHHVAGLPLDRAATDADPAIAVQDSVGRWRAEAAWPPTDAVTRRTTLKPGTYVDDAANEGSGSGTTGQGIWSFSAPLARAAHLAGTPRIALDIAAPAEGANLTANLYDVGPDRLATLISRGTTLTGADGTEAIELYGQDWILEAGHRIGVLVSSSNSEWWVHTPSNRTVEVAAASIELPFLPVARGAFIEGGSTSRLEQFREDAPFLVDEEIVDGNEVPFDVVAAEAARGAGPGAGAGGSGAGGPGAAAGAGAGTRGATPGAARRLTLDAAVDRRRLRRALARGLRTRIRCSERCTVTGRLTEKRGKRTRTVARFTRRTFAGRTTVQLRLSRATARRLRGARGARFTLRVEARTADGRRATISRALRLRR